MVVGNIRNTGFDVSYPRKEVNLYTTIFITENCK